MRIINDLNLKKQAEELGVSVWQTPSFLFFMMGIVIIVAMTAVYFASKNYDSPEILALAECVVVAVVLIIGNSIIRDVEQIARLNKMKSEFVSVASHQLRTPLSAIRWETELLMSKFKEGMSDKQLEEVRNISLLSTRMTRLVNDLLDVARIDQGRLILKKEKVDLEEIAQEITDNLLPLARSRDVRVILKKDEKIPLVSGDAEKLKLVVENLLSNAIKYSVDKGQVGINLLTDGRNVVFSIQDNGVGIPEDQQGRVFEKFFRSDNIVRYQTEGTGLGLYIAKNIVEQLGGRIWFKSRENVGTIFNFSMPVG